MATNAGYASGFHVTCTGLESNAVIVIGNVRVLDCHIRGLANVQAVCVMSNIG
jgi:hypothetical protein